SFSRETLRPRFQGSARNDEQRGHALHSLTAARTEYSKALRAAAAARDRIYGHAQQPTADYLSSSENKPCRNFMQRILLRNFYVPIRPDMCISSPSFIGKSRFCARSSTG